MTTIDVLLLSDLVVDCVASVWPVFSGSSGKGVPNLSPALLFPVRVCSGCCFCLSLSLPLHRPTAAAAASPLSWPLLFPLLPLSPLPMALRVSPRGLFGLVASLVLLQLLLQPVSAIQFFLKQGEETCLRSTTAHTRGEARRKTRAERPSSCQTAAHSGQYSATTEQASTRKASNGIGSLACSLCTAAATQTLRKHAGRGGLSVSLRQSVSAARASSRRFPVSVQPRLCIPSLTVLPLVLFRCFALRCCRRLLVVCSEDVLTGELLIGDFTITPSDGRVSVTVSDSAGAVVYSKSVSSEGKFAHTASKPGEYRMCFHNSEGISQKTVALALSSGGRDYKEMAKKDNLKPLEIELKRLEDAVTTIHQEMKFLQEREKQMRETNGQRPHAISTSGAAEQKAEQAMIEGGCCAGSCSCIVAALGRSGVSHCFDFPFMLACVLLCASSDSTSNRVIWFSVLSMLVLLALNGGQVLYLKQYFQAKKLIQ